MSFFRQRSHEEYEEIYALAKFIGDYNMQKGSIDERYLPYVMEVAAASMTRAIEKWSLLRRRMTEDEFTDKAGRCGNQGG